MPKLLLLVVGLALAAAVARPLAAQDAIVVQSDAVRNEFPRGVTFALTYTAPAGQKSARVQYEVAPDGTGASAVVECTGTTTASCSFTLTSGRDIFIIPGAEITYHWEIEDSAGNRLETPENHYVHEDPRFEFDTVTEGNITVYQYSATEQETRQVLQAAIESIAAMEALMQTKLTFPIKVFLYEDASDLQQAIVPSGGRGVRVLGEVVYSDTAMVSSEANVLDITRHEVAHIVTREATRGPFDIPDWLNEGISGYAQRANISGDESALQSAIRGDRVLTFRELSSPASGDSAGSVNLFYAQGRAIVTFLVNEYGADKFAELILTFKEGSTEDKAFQAVYGLDKLAVENAWRGSVGLDPLEEAPTPQPTRTDSRSDATATADDAPDGAPAATSNDGDGAPVVFIAIIIAAAAALLAAIVAAAAAVAKRQT